MNYVILDRGHGLFDDHGYTTFKKYPNGKYFKHGVDRDIYEGQLNDIICNYIIHYIADDPKLETRLVSSGNIDRSLSGRVKHINEISRDLGDSNCIMLSIHNDAFIKHTARGFTIYSSKRQTNSDILANKLVKSMGDRLIEMRNRGHKENDFYVIKNSRCPSCLVECGFFDNEDDVQLLSNIFYLQRIAKSIYEGVRSYFDKK